MRLVFLFAVVVVSLQARAEKILMIGDSLTCGHFGANVASNLRAGGNQVTVFCAVSSAPENWLNGTNPQGQICQTMSPTARALQPCEPNGRVPKLETILANNPVDRIVVALGTNSLHLREPSPAYETMANLVRSKASCQWIGPPHLRPDQAIGWSGRRDLKRGSPEELALSRAAIQMREDHLPRFVSSLRTKVDGKCGFVDSLSATASGPAHETSDGVHKGPIAGRTWAAALQSQLATRPRAAGAATGARVSRPPSR